jgi:superfamily II DNA/RNA helicase
MKFADLGLSDLDELLRAVTEAGYDTPTPIQAQAIPPGADDERSDRHRPDRHRQDGELRAADDRHSGAWPRRARMPRSLILEPTRELAAQVAENFEKYGKYHKLTMALLIGGVRWAIRSRRWKRASTC